MVCSYLALSLFLPLFIPQVTVHVPEPRVVEERSQQAARRTSNRRNAGQSSRGTRRQTYSTRATASMDVEESAEEEAAATPSDTEEDDEEDEWSESSRYVETRFQLYHSAGFACQRSHYGVQDWWVTWVFFQ